MTWQNLERYSAPKNTSHVESISSKTQEWETEFQSSSISQVVWVFASFCWVDLPGQGWNINQHTNDQKTHPSEVSIVYHLKMFKWSCEKYSLAADDTVRKMTPVAKGLPNQSVKNQDVKVGTMYYFGNMKQFFKAAWGSNMPNSTHCVLSCQVHFSCKIMEFPPPPL